MDSSLCLKFLGDTLSFFTYMHYMYYKHELTLVNILNILLHGYTLKHKYAWVIFYNIQLHAVLAYNATTEIIYILCSFFYDSSNYNCNVTSVEHAVCVIRWRLQSIQPRRTPLCQVQMSLILRQLQSTK